jgi:L-lactate dehydrogenase
VTTSNVHADIVGEHGDTEFPLWSTARIGPVPILEWRGGDPFTVPELDEIAREVRDAAYTVIRGKGATNYAIGLAGARIVEAVVNDEHAIMPVSTVLGGLHGIEGVALSVPTLVSGDGAAPLSETPFSDDERRMLRASADAISAAVATLGI